MLICEDCNDAPVKVIVPEIVGDGEKVTCIAPDAPMPDPWQLELINHHVCRACATKRIGEPNATKEEHEATDARTQAGAQGADAVEERT